MITSDILPSQESDHNPFTEIGSSDFEKFVTSKTAIFVDKTLFIKDIINSQEVMLFTRPRRWGKTLNMSMLEYFFSIPAKDDGSIDQDKHQQKYDILSKMAIGSNQEIMNKYCCQYPVIFISFTGTKAATVEGIEERLSELIYICYSKHKYLLQSTKLDDIEKERFNEYLTRSANRAALEKALLHLSNMLHKHFSRQVVVLIDEYDAPMNDWYVQTLSAEKQNLDANNIYLEEILSLFRNMFEAVLKNNASLYKGVVTGILRIAKASLFSGLNNFGEDSILHKQASQYFGFTEEEVKQLLHNSGIDHNPDTANDMRTWYNGYNIGGVTIYNPWSIMNFLKTAGELDAYWVGTASTALIENALMLDKFQEEIQSLIEGNAVYMTAESKMVFSEIKSSPNALYNLLLFSGYLTATQIYKNGDGTYDCEVRIPNYEIRGIFIGSIKKWVYQKLNIETNEYSIFIHSLLEGSAEVFATKLKNYLEVSASFYSTGPKNAEVFYNGFMLGLIASISNKYFVETEKESGKGRADLILIPKVNAQYRNAIVIEFKSTRNEDDLRQAADGALEQIKNKNYVSKIKTHDDINRIISVGLAFCGKDVEVVYEDLVLKS